MRNQSRIPNASEQSFPEDLRAWMPDPQLSIAVAESVEWMTTEGDARLTRAGEMVLAILAYSYATGIYSSEEIERNLRQSRPTLMFGNQTPAEGFRVFRRHFRPLIETCLGAVLCEANEIHAESASDSISTPRINEEATARVLRAIQTDSWALDT